MTERPSVTFFFLGRFKITFWGAVLFCNMGAKWVVHSVRDDAFDWSTMANNVPSNV